MLNRSWVGVFRDKRRGAVLRHGSQSLGQAAGPYKSSHQQLARLQEPRRQRVPQMSGPRRTTSLGAVRPAAGPVSAVPPSGRAVGQQHECPPSFQPLRGEKANRVARKTTDPRAITLPRSDADGGCCRPLLHRRLAPQPAGGGSRLLSVAGRIANRTISQSMPRSVPKTVR